MNYYRVDHSAQVDLSQIWAYVANDSVSAADRLIVTFKDKFRLLATQPLMGELRPELAPNLRSFSVGNYVIFYRPAEDGIEVVRVIHSARDVNAQF